MKRIAEWIISEESGQGMVEYSLIISFVAIALIFSFTLFREKLQVSINKTSNNIP